VTDGDLLWADAPTGARTRGPRPLTRARIVAAAVEIADAHDLAGLSMPQLARALDSAPMSLYRHVPDKDALIGLMLDHAIGPAPDLDPEHGWRAALATWARANRAVFERHPWTLPLVSSGSRPMGPQECAWAEAALRVVVSAGVPIEEAPKVLLLVNSYVRGAAVPLADRSPTAETLARHGWSERLPLYYRLLSSAGRNRSDPGSADETFEFGLARCLDGVAVHVGEL
jgi:AcrR family transcriptional regulator